MAAFRQSMFRRKFVLTISVAVLLTLVAGISTGVVLGSGSGSPPSHVISWMG